MENLVEVDYYGFLNISKTASTEEINNAYRRLSLIYHPDKHIDEKHKKWAETIFNKTKKVYEVLSDPQKRSIYDVLGVEGLKTENWKVAETPRSYFYIREEYERLEQEKRDRDLKYSINPTGTVVLSINATDIFSHYEGDYKKKEVEKIFTAIEVSSLSIAHSIDAPLSHKDTSTISTNVSTHNGLGVGSVNISSRRNISERGWAAMELSAGNGLRYGIKGCHSLTQSIFLNCSGLLRFSTYGIHPSLVSSLSMQMDQNTVGYLTYRTGPSSSMTTTVIRSTEIYNSSLSVQFGIPHSFILASYSRKIFNRHLKVHASIKVGTFGFLVEYGLEKKLGKQNNISGTVMIGVPTGVILKINVTREHHSFIFPIHICEEVLMAPIFYATIFPIVSWLTIKHLIIDPLNNQKLKKNKEEMIDKYNFKIAEMQKESQYTVVLMQDMYNRLKADEERVGGLIIIQALYGIAKIPSINDRSVLDVTVPLQCLVKNSKLQLQETSKAHLPGFYDIAIGREKFLTIDYTFHCQKYRCTVRDDKALNLPDIVV